CEVIVDDSHERRLGFAVNCGARRGIRYTLCAVAQRDYDDDVVYGVDFAAGPLDRAQHRYGHRYCLDLADCKVAIGLVVGVSHDAASPAEFVNGSANRTSSHAHAKLAYELAPFGRTVANRPGKLLPRAACRLGAGWP